MSTYAYRSRNVTMVAHIYDSKLEEMGADWVRKKAHETAALARVKCPRRTGHLMASIKVGRRVKAGSITSIVVRAGAGYAAYVHEGTYSMIMVPQPYKRTGKYAHLMWVPKSKGSGKREWRHAVRGQPSQPFLASSMHEVLAGTISPFRDPRVPIWVPPLP
jgi:hypothetical protein